MIFSIFALLLALSICLVALGYYLQGSGDILKFTGFCFIFLLGVMLMPEMPGSIEYKTGEIQNVSGSTTTVTYQYTEYDSHSYGFFLALVGGFGFVVALTDRKKKPNHVRLRL